jgi:hypothetical protein
MFFSKHHKWVLCVHTRWESRGRMESRGAHLPWLSSLVYGAGSLWGTTGPSPKLHLLPDCIILKSVWVPSHSSHTGLTAFISPGPGEESFVALGMLKEQTSYSLTRPYFPLGQNLRRQTRVSWSVPRVPLGWPSTLNRDLSMECWRPPPIHLPALL